MAEINQNQSNTGKKNGGKGAKRFKHRGKHSTRMDMTPMVDLAFLLLTFFMLTTTFSREKIMQVHQPVPVNPPTPLPPNTITLLIGKNDQLIYYQGKFNPQDKSSFHKSSFTNNGIRKELIEHNQTLYNAVSKIEADYADKMFNDSIYFIKINQAKKDKTNEGVNVIIKSTDDASYRNLVYILDEMEICNVVNYSIVDITQEEETILNSQ